MLPVIETFLSIDGEGPTAGELATFVRFRGCNLRCAWCDTAYSFDKNEPCRFHTAQELYKYVCGNPARNVTLTGGEPLLQSGLPELLGLLCGNPALQVHIETNGSIPLRAWIKQFPNAQFVIDFKLPGSGMTDQMVLENLTLARPQDVYKFVVQDHTDLEYAKGILEQYDLCARTQVHFSPVMGKIRPADVVDYMKVNKLDRVRLQVQLHKIVWDPQERGV